MTARDFTAEQAYFRSRHTLHQRTLHGAGIVCGLDVVPHPNDACAREGHIVITPGIAVDCYGREVIVREPVVVRLDQLFPADCACGDEKQAREKPDDPDSGPSEPPSARKWFLLGVRYGEVCVEPVPVLADESGCDPRTAMNRIRDKACLRYLAFADKPPACWGRPVPSAGPCPPPVKPSAKEIPKSLEEVLKPLCSDCGDFVPLAACQFAREDGKVSVPTDEQEYIDKTGRRYLPGPLSPQQLTHLCGVNWTHGTDTPLSQLREGLTKDTKKRFARLVFRLDRRLDRDVPHSEKDDHELGFWKRILQIRYQNSEGELQPLEWLDRARIRVTHHGTQIEYLFRVRELRHEVQLDNPILHVSLACDFLTDSYGRAVDGNHLLGRLPSGDGVEGGTFESWFRLTGLTPESVQHDDDASDDGID